MESKKEQNIKAMSVWEPSSWGRLCLLIRLGLKGALGGAAMDWQLSSIDCAG
jgi:hypothetical protein